jgi:signal transduction histidine kinase
MMKQFSPSQHSAHVFSNVIVTQAVHAAWTGATGATDGPVERERSHLTAGVSHELRTPLTILKGRLHGIRDGVIDGTPDETERLLRQVDHILHIVDDLDALAHADTGRLVLECEGIELGDVIRPVVADLQPLLARHGLRLEGAYRRARVYGDPHRLQQVFTNLLTNAAKHSLRGGKISVMIEVKDRQAVASVTDEGPGIAPGDEEHLFKPFWRSAATRNRPGCTGTGLGLTLTARLVLAHGGRIEVANRADRSGATFRVVLPLA